jgi:3-hydroxymyristoyl/3-hydroxydecanoyl-(acyl carrier protein) dehydratase
MSILRKEIKSNMSGLRDDGREITAHFRFPREFTGFKGHFPGKPILPGVCKLQAILCMLEESTRKTPQLKEIVSAKFFTPVTCDEEIVFTVRRVSECGEDARVLALIAARSKKIAEIQIEVNYE